MRFSYHNVFLDAISYTLPEEIVTSAQIEAQLEPLYRRLRLPEGRLELMTGIAERRFWPAGTLPGDISVQTAEKAIGIAGLDNRHVGALVHGSVSRDYVEPATACAVHHRLGLPEACMIYDLSNACLGLLGGAVQVANMIELGQIRAGVVVGTETGRGLVENTIRQLNSDTSLSRGGIKPAVASLTIGSGSAAMVLVDRGLSRTGNRLLGGVARANTDFCHLCRSDCDESAGAAQQLMATDSEALLRQGVETARLAFDEFLDTLGWQKARIDKTFCHQVGRAHQKLLFETLGLDPRIDYVTFDRLGNTGAVALPTAAAIGIEQGRLAPGDRVALLGIGSGINVLMLGLDWRKSTVDEKA
jgi:3-oxoacyl-[acyl-carrier-protein] synthase-3